MEDKRSPATRDGYRRDLRDFFQFAAQSDPSPELVNQFLGLEQGQAVTLLTRYKADMESRGLKPATINPRLCAVRSLVKMARRIGRCQFSLQDVDGVKSKPYRDTRGIEVAQIRKVLQQPDRSIPKSKRDYAILMLLWECALRRSELCKINLSDLKPSDRTLTVYGKGKGREGEIMDLSDRTIAALTDWLEVRSSKVAPDAPVFTNLRDGDRLTGESIRAIVADYAKRAGIQKTMSPHRIRHSAITAALDASNGDVRRVQKFSRHANIRTLMIYDDNRHRHQGEITDLLADLV